MRCFCVALLAAVGSTAGVANAQYTFEMRLIADGMAGSPGGPTPGTTYNIGGPAVPNSRIGFWLQARVAQTSGQNWGITRASTPAGGASFISVSDPAHSASVTRATVNSGGTLFGRGVGYRNGGTNTGATGNNAGNAPFPGTGGNENGGLDDAGSGTGVLTRIYGFDAYVGATRADTDADGDGDFDDNGDGFPENPWRVNGGTANAGVDGVPFPADGTFSPWANLYRFVLDLSDLTTTRSIVISANALLNGAIQAAPTSQGGNAYAMQLSPGQTVAENFTITIWPTPGPATALGLLLGSAARRRSR